MRERYTWRSKRKIPLIYIEKIGWQKVAHFLKKVIKKF